MTITPKRGEKNWIINQEQCREKIVILVFVEQLTDVNLIRNECEIKNTPKMKMLN